MKSTIKQPTTLFFFGILLFYAFCFVLSSCVYNAPPKGVEERTVQQKAKPIPNDSAIVYIAYGKVVNVTEPRLIKEAESP